MSLREAAHDWSSRHTVLAAALGCDAGSRPHRPWWVTYRRFALLCDLLAVGLAMALANILRFTHAASTTVVGVTWLTYPAISALIAACWVLALGMRRAYSRHLLGFGDEEYRAIAHATFVLFGGLSMVAVLLRVDVARGFLAIALPLGLLLLVLGRWGMRQVLVRRRRSGAMLEDSLLIGSREAVTWTAEHIRGVPAAGYRVRAVVCPEPGAPETLVLGDGTSLPNLRDRDRIPELLERTGMRSVIVADDVHTDRAFLRHLSWQLEDSDVHLVLTSRLTDVAGPRIHWRPVEGLPLMTVDTPRFTGAKYALKRAFDLVVAVLGVVLSLPLLVLAGLAVKLQDGGPVLYRQERVGIDGRVFTMYKLRSMREGAAAEQARLHPANQGAGPLFKLHDDPRVTPVGRVLRTWSVDEMPQLFNVLRGDMAVVGPRPQLASEVAQLPEHMLRRLKVKPGITGPWQVGGRSSLSAEESARLDLSYVENWSLVGDAIIVLKTAKAVLTRNGAY
ncbi:sugar transferase [Kocuria sp.]|uniref:sugar transferase n=1 Tax=Kocuria sp. TaxID=1871328 RepID=UPI0026DAABBB|nr:sugar transferase [Kocuria sp.]MDO4919660.1 sugar transferase [Kocuria sp.]